MKILSAFPNLISFIITTRPRPACFRFFIDSTRFKLPHSLTMPPKPTGKKALPKRSRAVPVKLARKTCLRCSKRIFDDPTHRCGYKDFQKCGACVRKHKDCDKARTRPVVATQPLLTVIADSSQIRPRSQSPSDPGP